MATARISETLWLTPTKIPIHPITSARLIFVLVFVINCILWSQSRYGQMHQTSLASGGPGLMKRYMMELGYAEGTIEMAGRGVKTVSRFYLRNMITAYSDSIQCRPPAFPTEEQCAHVQKECPAPRTFLSVHYLREFYCTKANLRTWDLSTSSESNNNCG